MKKKKKIKYTVIGMLLIFVSSLTIFVSNPSYAIDIASYDVGSNGVGQLTISWLEGDQAVAGHVDENGILQVSPKQNNIYDSSKNTGGGVHVSYQLVFNMGGSQIAEPGTVEIRIPRYIFYGRNGLPIKDQVIDIPLVEAPSTDGTVFNYHIETGSDGIEYIVLENFEDIPPSFNFSASFTWILKDPSTVANGFTKKIKGTVDLDLDKNGTTDINSTSNEIEMKYNTQAKIREVKKAATYHYDEDIGGSTNVYSMWQSDWVDELKPQNADNYVYAITYAYAEVYYATQPYSITFTDKINDKLGGEIIGYCRYDSNNDTASKRGDSGANCFKKDNGSMNTDSGRHSHKASLSPLSASVKSPSATKDEFQYFYFLVKYPRNVVQDNKIHEMSDVVTAKLVSVDGEEDTKTANLKIQYRSEFVDVDEKRTEGFFPARVIDTHKFGWRNLEGGINIIENEKDGFELGMGYSPEDWSVFPFSFYFGRYIQDYPSTLKEGGSRSNPDDYGQSEWTANFVDDIAFLGDNITGFERLESGDYQLTHLSILDYNIYDYVYHPEGYETVEINWKNCPKIDVYYTKDDADWILYGSIKFTSANDFTFTSTTGETYSGSKGWNAKVIPLPKGTTGVKGSVKTKYGYVRLTLNVNCYLIVNDHIRSLVKDKKSVDFFNYSTTYSEDRYGNIYGTFDGDAYDKSNYEGLRNEVKEVIENRDKKLYGHVLGHHSGSTNLTRLETGSTHQNKWVVYENDPANRLIKAKYTSYATEHIDCSGIEPKQMLNLGLINEQRIGTFYDLLPLGMNVDVNTIEVQTFTTSGLELDYNVNEAEVGKVIPSSYSLVDNWQDSGQTMLIVKAVVPDDMDNYYLSIDERTAILCTGMTLRFTGVYSWDSYYDYGTNLTNTVAYKSGSGKLINGYKDDASEQTGLALKEFMTDLDGDGNPEETTIADTVYAQRTMATTLNIASSTSFTKGVKTANMMDYVDGKDGSVVVAGGGNYTYRLRYASQKNVDTTNLILYDVLEDYDDGIHETWKGVLQKVDVSQMIAKGIDAKVYYSTKKNIDLYVNGKASVDLPPPPDANLEDITIWSLEPPENMAAVTAIAIDCSTAVNGKAYTLAQESSVVAVLTMKAPLENINSLVDRNAKALNAAWWSGTTQQLNQVAHDNFTVFEWTQVGLKNVDIEVDKESYIPSGTKDNPAIVEKNGTIIYDIVVKNTSDWAIHKNVKVRDTLPKEVKPMLKDITYYIEGEGSLENSTLVSESGIIQMTNNEQAVEFTISQLLSGDTLHLLIPTTVVNSENIKVIENKALLFEFDDTEYNQETKTTYHKLTSPEFGNLTIKKKVKDGDKQKQFRFKITLINPNDNKIRKAEDKEKNNELESSSNDSESIEKEEVDYDPLNKTYGDVEFHDGVAYINLSDKQSKTISNIPSGFQYIVEEEDYSKEGYITSIKNSSGTITNSYNTEVEVTNTYIENPDTGASFKFVIILILLGFITFIILHKHKSKIYKV